MIEGDVELICFNCVKLPSLKKYIAQNGAQFNCVFCQKQEICSDVKTLQAFMLEKVYQVLVPVDDLSSYDQGMVFDCGADEPHIFELWAFFEDYEKFACDAFMESFIDIIPREKDDRGNVVFYALNDGTLDEINEFEDRWESFLESIRHGNRFFNELAKKFLDDLFSVFLLDSILDDSIVNVLDSETPLYRARIASDANTMKEIWSDPVKQLGPTPAYLASNQRMSPEGISVFYGALDRATCISEIRPLVGDKVISGEFRALADLKLLNLNKLVDLRFNLDFFDENYVRSAHASAFFKELIFQMSRPARRDSKNSYISTQVIFEYLSVIFREQLDGIVYRSVQQDQSGECIALFPGASFVSATGSCQLTISIEDSHRDKDEKLFFVPGSLLYHRVRGVAYQQEDFDDDFIFTLDDKILRKTFPSDRF